MGRDVMTEMDYCGAVECRFHIERNGCNLKYISVKDGGYCAQYFDGNLPRDDGEPLANLAVGLTKENLMPHMVELDGKPLTRNDLRAALQQAQEGKLKTTLPKGGWMVYDPAEHQVLMQGTDSEEWIAVHRPEALSPGTMVRVLDKINGNTLYVGEVKDVQTDPAVATDYVRIDFVSDD